jgi:hypothetical protein
MPEPALADHQRHTLTSHLDRVRVTKLMLAFARAPVGPDCRRVIGRRQE